MKTILGVPMWALLVLVVVVGLVIAVTLIVTQAANYQACVKGWRPDLCAS